ncbi:CST complex subunit CTC1 isoform X1 [Oncorhynchus tshawytscha]|uniref:CST complex subunit CTC1 isoform X1 n=1 Tax=Oncorhynchus tshawytscha TaxID=74940 RepID=UPI001C3CE4A4|nr:CST complex subunit CTC1 isoform X1 [Oncorhynchus tshawytscha]
MESFMDNFRERSEVEREWLQELFVFVRDNLFPVLGPTTGSVSPEQLSLAMIRRVERAVGSSSARSLPLSYRLISVAELVTWQRTPCCSNLTWSTAQHREWVREAEQALPNHKALPRASLLLIGCLSDGCDPERSCDGAWRVRDATGTVHCELLSPSPLWLGLPVLFPCWNYIPQPALGKDQEVEERGYLELVGCPLALTSVPEMTFNPAEVNLKRAVGVREAAELIQHRVRGLRVKVYGEVSGVYPLLNIAGKSLFCLRLREGRHTLPLLVTEPCCLWWQQCVCVGGSVCVSGLRVCALQGWSGNRVLCATSQSSLTLLPDTLIQDLSDPPTLDKHTPDPDPVGLDPPLSDCSSTGCPLPERRGAGPDPDPVGLDPPLSDCSSTGCPLPERRGAGPDPDPVGIDPTLSDCSSTGCPLPERGPDPDPSPILRPKLSKAISYKGVLTSVLSAAAGLYVIDGKVGLCLAYQPLQRRGLRPGAEIELHDVHFLYRPSPHFHPCMLCVCLHSSLRVTSFSRLGSEVDRPSDAPLPWLLLERNLGVSQYLWLCHCCRALRDRLVPRWVKEECVYVVARRLFECVVTSEKGGGRRDIYREMLQEPHHCPLTEYSVSSPVCEYVSVSDCVCVMEKECWSSLSLSSLLPACGSSLTQAELNPSIAWSVGLSLGQDIQPRPLLLVGVLELPGTHTLRLRDQTGAVTCVAVETGDDDSGGQRAANNTAWIGCLVCVQRFTMVMERFVQSEFPSYRHLDQDSYITHKHCRVYIQLCLNDLQILSPSAAMASLLLRENIRTTQGGERVEGGEREEMSETERERREKGGEEREERRDDVSERKKRSREEERIEEKKEEREGGAKRARQNHTENETCSQPGGGASLPGDRPCISVVMCVEGKEGVAWRNEGIACEGEEAGLSLCFSVRADLIGQIQRWGRDPRNCPLQERETDGQTRTVELLFVRSSVRWFPLIQAGSFYRLIAPNTQDPSVLIGCRVAGRSGVVLHTNPSLLVRSDWRIHTLTHPLLTTPYSQFVSQKVMSVAEVLDCSSGVDLVSFHGVISQRITLQRGTTTHTPTQRGTTTHTPAQRDVEAGLSVRLTVCVEPRGRSLQVYLDLSLTPYPPGLVPGNTVQFTSFQRRLSRVGGVYCRSVPVSCLTIMALGKTDTQSCDSPPPMILLGVWALAGAEQCILGRVRGHVVCVLYLQLQWTCSLCGSIYTQERCTRSQPPCNSTSAVFQAEAKAAVEDGSGEAHIWFSCPVISGLLGLAMPQWEGLQRSLRVRGHLRVYTRGRSLVCDVDADDPLLQYLSCVCSSSTVCRPLTLICTLHTRSHTPAARREDSSQLKRFTRGDREFVTRMPPPLQLTCTHILEERERD